MNKDDELTALCGEWSICSEGTQKVTDKGRHSVNRFLYELGYRNVSEAIKIAFNKNLEYEEDRFRYFCGVCYWKIKDKDRVEYTEPTSEIPMSIRKAHKIKLDPDIIKSVKPSMLDKLRFSNISKEGENYVCFGTIEKNNCPECKNCQSNRLCLIKSEELKEMQ